MKKFRVALSAAIFFSSVFLAGGVRAAEDEYRLVIKDHQFSPKTLEVPSGKKIKLIVKNEDASAEEFESFDLNREKVVAGNAEITVFVGPLAPGSYQFFGDFHQDTAQGVLEAK